MRIPYVIRKNTIITYEPSDVALKLIGEIGRNTYPENFEWDSELCPSLVTLCIQSLAKNFENRNCYDDLIGSDKDHLLELLSTSLPLELTVPLIHVEDYWRKCYEEKYGNCPYQRMPGFSWKVTYLEKYICEVIEQLQPQYNDEDNIEPLTILIGPFVKKLIIKQLQPWLPPLTMSPDDIPEVYPSDHINFVPIFKKLENIVELDITYFITNLGDDFSWRKFDLSPDDCKRLGAAILQLKFIKILRLHRSKIEDLHIQALLQQLAKNTTIIEMDFSHCHISNKGALCIGKFLTLHKTLTKLILTNNFIGDLGGKGIGFALTQETCCPLEVLDLRLNPLGHEGTMGILRALVRQNTINLKELSLAGCLFEDETSLRVAQMIGLNQSIERLDISNNWFDKEAYDTLLERIVKNTWIKWLDMRETDIPVEIKEKINKFLVRNRLGLSIIIDDEEKAESEEIFEEADEELEEIMLNEEEDTVNEEGGGEARKENQ